MGPDILLLVLSVTLALLLARTLRIAKEHERFAVTTVGRFDGLRGPGLLFKWMGSEAVWTRLALGQLGTYVGDGMARFEDATVPVSSDQPLGHAVRIEGFEKNSVTVIPAQVHVVRCEKCQHLNEVAA